MSTANFYAIYRRAKRCYVDAASGEYVDLQHATRFATRRHASNVAKGGAHPDNTEIHHVQVTTDVLERRREDGDG